MKQRLYIAAADRAEKAASGVKSAGEVVRRGYTKAITYGMIGVGSLMVASSSFAQTATVPTQTYGLGQGNSPLGSDYFNAASGFNASLAPMLTAVLPVLVVILAIWTGPKLLKRLVTMMAH